MEEGSYLDAFDVRAANDGNHFHSILSTFYLDYIIELMKLAQQQLEYVLVSSLKPGHLFELRLIYNQVYTDIDTDP